MVRVLLVQPPHRDTFGYSMPPLGPLHLGAAARAAGHAVEFLDLALAARRGELAEFEQRVPDCAERIAAAEPDVIGIGAMISSMPMALHLAAEVKRRLPHVPIVLGGQGPETIEEAIIARYPAIDAVAVGEADASFVEWLAALEQATGGRPRVGNDDGLRAVPPRDARSRGHAEILAGPEHATLAESPDDKPARRSRFDPLAFLTETLLGKRPPAEQPAPARRSLVEAVAATAHVPGFVIRRGGLPHRTPSRAVLVDLDDVPSPAWDLAESPRAYKLAAGGDEALFPIDLGRGCTFACSFCTTPVFWGRRARQLSPRRAADEFDRLAALDGLDAVYVTHDLFTVDRERVLAICEEKLRRGNALPWECRTRIDLVDPELLTVMREAGCRRILYGVESDSPRMLAAVDKGGKVVARGWSTAIQPRDRGATGGSAGSGSGSGSATASAAATGSATDSGPTDVHPPHLSFAAEQARRRGKHGGVPAPVFDHRAALRAASEVGMASILGTMCGIPGESAADVEANLRLMADAATLDGVSLSIHWFNVTPGNGRVAETEHALRLVPGLSADLVRGYDLPAGWIDPAQQRLIEDDAEVFRAFRVFAPHHSTPRELYLVTRNAHLLLEVLPRTIRALAGRTHQGSLLETLVAFFTHVAETTPSLARTREWVRPSRLDETPLLEDVVRHSAKAPSSKPISLPGGALPPDVEPFWAEPLVLSRRAAVGRFADYARHAGDPLVATLADYEQALHETLGTRLVHFEIDPAPLVRELDRGTWPPEHVPGPGSVLFSRSGERVRAQAVSPFLADAAVERDDARLLERWPDCTTDTVVRARELLAVLGAGG